MEIDLRMLEPRHAYDLMTGIIIPRPIAWVSTIGANGRANLAPFSFFTGVTWNPPTLAFSPVNRADGSRKDTVVNIEATGEFVVNLVSVDLLAKMEASAKPLPYGEDELLLEGVTFVPSKTVRPYRIAEAKAAFECALDRIVTVGEGAGAGNLILGRILRLYAADEVVPDGCEVDWRKLDALGRLSGNRYCAIRSVLESETN